MARSDHHIVGAVHTETYWAGNVSSGKSEAWTRVDVVPMGSWNGLPCWSFSPQQTIQMATLIHGFQVAFAFGEKSARDKVRQALGITQ